jgi:2-C-methyl-D-erythritol 4-phosphate cytidylyltransferase
MSVVALVVAAGSGTRFGGPVAKPLVDLDGRPVVAVAVESLAAGGCQAATVLISAGMQEVFAAALADAPIPVSLVEGGQTRQESVRQGLEALAIGPEPPEVVLIHDAVRPLVPAGTVERVVEAVRAGAVAVTPVLPMVDSLRRVAGDGSNAIVDRGPLRRIQTPQGFDFGTVLAGHRLAAERGLEVTDDVSVCEAAGHPVTLVEGAASAVKITHPADLELVRALVRTSAVQEIG